MVEIPDPISLIHYRLIGHKRHSYRKLGMMWAIAISVNIAVGSNDISRFYN